MTRFSKIKSLFTLLAIGFTICTLSSCTDLNFLGIGRDKVEGNGDMTVEERSTSEYDEIGLAGNLDVILAAGKEGTITIEAESNLLEFIETEVNNGKLIIREKKGYFVEPSAGKAIVIHVPIEDISELSVAGSGEIISKESFQLKKIALSVAGSGDIHLNLTAEEVEANIAGSGDIQLGGTTEYFSAEIAGSGDIAAYHLVAEVVEVEIAGSGDIEVTATKKIKAEVAGSGDIRYKGNPTERNVQVAGSGSVEPF